MNKPSGILLALALALTACQAAQVPAGQGQPAPLASASSLPLPSKGPDELPAASSPSPSSPSAVVPAGNGLPANLAGIRFAAGNRFLTAIGQTARFEVLLVDALGAPIVAVVPLEWSSSRPQDFAVDAQGNLTALVPEGFSTIVARIPGTSFQASVLINISSSNGAGGGARSGGGGGGGGAPANTPPVIESLSASSSTVTGAGNLVRLSGSARDAEDVLSDASYSWSCAPQPECGSFTPASGPTVYWESPASGGSYAITLTVSDGSQETSQALSIEVLAGSGSLVVNPS